MGYIYSCGMAHKASYFCFKSCNMLTEYNNGTATIQMSSCIWIILIVDKTSWIFGQGKWSLYIHLSCTGLPPTISLNTTCLARKED